MDLAGTYKPVSTIRLSLIVVLIISILFPLLFAYINNELELVRMLIEMVVSPIRMLGITLIVFGVIEGMNRLFSSRQFLWLRYIIEFPIIAFINFYWLRVSIYILDRPFGCDDCVFSMDNWGVRQYVSIFLVAALFIYIFQTGLNLFKLAQQKAAEAEKYQKECAVVCLQALKNQVNPHFLFNSLSVLSSLVHVSAETSDKFIQHLSKAYRYLLDQKDLEWVTLKAELDFLDAYFFLLQIRFEKKIRLDKSISLDAQAYTLPPLTLQLLIENVVKHNKMSANEPLIIEVTNEGEHLVVKNNINKRELNETSTGIGLENIRKRYEYITDKKIEIILADNKFIVRLPLIKLNSYK